jgi:hypothetical protein
LRKEQDEDWAEKHVERLHEVTSPGNVVAEESTPTLAVAGTCFFMYRCTVSARFQK